MCSSDLLHSPSSERAKELVEDIRSFVLVIRDLVDAGILKIASEMAVLDALCESQEEAQIEEIQEEAQEEVQVQSEEDDDDDDDDDLFKFISVPEIRTIYATQQHEENVVEQMQQEPEPEEKKPEKKSFLETFINGGEEKKEPEIQHDKSITDPFESDLDRFPDVFDSGEHKF